MKFINKIISVLILISIMFAQFCSVIAAENVCVLSDFENGLDGWNNDFESTMYRTSDEAHSGNFSLETTVMNNYGCPKFHFRFIPNVKYRVSVWVKVKGAADVAQVIFDYSAYGQQQPWWSFFGINTPVSNEGWTQIAFDYVYNGGNPTGDTNIFIRIGDGLVDDLASEERKTYYIDDLKISYQNPNYNYVETKYSHAETAVNMGFDANTEGYHMENARMKYVKDGCNNTYGAALVMTNGKNGYVGQDYIVEEGKRYELSAYIKSPEKVLPFKYMVSEKINGKYITRQLSGEKKIGNEWTKLTANYELRDDGSSNEKTFFILGGNGKEQVKYYLDEFSILRYDSDRETQYRDKNRYVSNPSGKLVLNVGQGNIIGEAEPYFENSEFMCCAKTLAEAIGAQYSELKDKKAVITKGIKKLTIDLESGLAYFNDKVKLQKCLPTYKDGKLMISANFITEVFGLDAKFLKDCNVFYIDNLKMNRYFSNTVKKINSQEKIKIAFFGSDFVRGENTDYPIVKPLKERIVAWFSESYPNSEVDFINSELNGTDSTLGVCRLEQDVLSYNPDLVFIDFSVNDYELNSPKQAVENVENIIRRIRENKSETDIVIVNSFSNKMVDAYKSGQQTFLTKIYKDLAQYYDAAFLDLGKTLYDDCVQSGSALTDYLIQNIQITEKTANLYAGAATALIKESIENNDNLAERKAKKAIFDSNSEYRMIGVKAAECTPEWKLENKEINGTNNTEYLFADTKGSSLSIDFTGTSVGVMWEVSPKSGAVEFKIDDGEWEYLDIYDTCAYKYSRMSYAILKEGLENTNHKLTIRIAKNNPESMGNEVSIGGFLEKRRNN